MTLRIRLATPADAAAVAQIYAPAVSRHATSFELTPPDPDEMARRIARLLPRLPWLVAEQEGAVEGYAYATPYRERAAYQWSVETSVYVAEWSHRGGVGRALYTSLFAVLAELGLCTAYAVITLPNPASEGFHRAMGFRPLAVFRGVGFKLGAWHDVAWMERAIRPRPANPEPPTPLGNALDDPRIEQAIRSPRAARSS